MGCGKSVFSFLHTHFDQCAGFEVVVRVSSVNPEIRVGVDIPLVDLIAGDKSSSEVIFCVKGMRDVERALTSRTLPYSDLMQQMNSLFNGNKIENVLLVESDIFNGVESLMLSIGHIVTEIDTENKIIRFKMTGRGAGRIRHEVVFTQPPYNDLASYSSS